MTVIVPVGGIFADSFRVHVLTTTNVRKLFTCTGFGAEAIFLLFIAFFKNDAAMVISSLILAFFVPGFAVSGEVGYWLLA